MNLLDKQVEAVVSMAVITGLPFTKIPYTHFYNNAIKKGARKPRFSFIF